MAELQEAQERLEKKREKLNQMESGTRLTRNTKETYKEVLARLREKANETGISQLIRTPDDTYLSVSPDKVRFGRCGIPKKYVDCEFETFKGNDRLVEDVKMANEQKQDILLIGNTGSGKTHLAVACLKENKGVGYFTSIPMLLVKIRDTFNNNAVETESDIIEKYCDYECLVLDDLGAEKTSEYSIATLYVILDKRINDCKRMIITTNLSLEEIEDKLSARIASRLAEMKIIKINMPDYRKKR